MRAPTVLLRGLLLLLLLAAALPARAGGELLLEDARPRVEAWPVVEILPDPQRRLDWVAALRAAQPAVQAVSGTSGSEEALSYQLAIDNIEYLAADPDRIPTNLTRFSDGTGSGDYPGFGYGMARALREGRAEQQGSARCVVRPVVLQMEVARVPDQDRGIGRLQRCGVRRQEVEHLLARLAAHDPRARLG